MQTFNFELVDSHLHVVVLNVLCGGLSHVSRDNVFLSADELSFGEKIAWRTDMVRERECMFTCSREHANERWGLFCVEGVFPLTLGVN